MPRPGIPDPFRTRAKAEGYVARAVYKLKEIDEKYRLFSQGQRVLDLGCSPGSWLQYIAARVGPRGLVLGVDAAPLAIPVAPPLYFLQGDIKSLDLEILAAISPVFDVVVSDLAPKTTGVRDVDQQRSLELTKSALGLARRFLRHGGHFLAKIFAGPDLPTLAAAIQQEFRTFRQVKPAGSRAASRELYLLGLNRLNGPKGPKVK
ncbi:MAG: RlmE family RNA methyltransferase [Deltaproteobacteria bacterium]|nr:RlmE family RNA methyltransferase [Deltaproteobacteria bacterium]